MLNAKIHPAPPPSPVPPKFLALGEIPPGDPTTAVELAVAGEDLTFRDRCGMPEG
jgi:hypothetical protein